ncbi:DUF397 domain-containing protein [Streptomyces avicenniae]|uniref:DUF397 domain-containing protein n=1 Tax=Streptomyces avicenniae TaxID=500153 RepID=UPI000AAFF8E5|nr:DUF397 domain-containing protein [Streptomyces avicenniae]
MNTPDNHLPNQLTWRAPRRSQANGDCVEVTEGIPGAVPVRDSKNPGPVIVIRTHAWTTFTNHLKR